jgi:lipid A 3-O-deacylase
LEAHRYKSLAALLFFLPAAGCILSLTADAYAEDQGRFTILEENDSLFFNSDKHYTQGLRLSNLSPTLVPESGWNEMFDLVDGNTPILQSGRDRRIALFLGQSIFTPKNLSVKPPDPQDRPYAGWLYVGASLLQDTDRQMLENLELDAGVVGPGSLAKQVQNDFHQFIGVAQAKGWSSQLQNEPGIMLTYERLWRLPLTGNPNNGIDIVPQLGATAGNVMTYGEVGGLLRIGKGLQADYGPVRVRPALSGTDYFDTAALDGDVGFYFFAGAQGRFVGHNIFLDGNTFRNSASVPKKYLVADLQAGFSLLWSSAFRFDVSVSRRTEEFRGQRTPDETCTVAAAFNW